MIVLGVILAILGWFLGIYIVEMLGVILLVVGAVLLLLGASGHAIGSRRYYY